MADGQKSGNPVGQGGERADGTRDKDYQGREFGGLTKSEMNSDPEVNLGGAEFLTQGLDYFINPPTRSFVLSFSLSR
jgi:hypothetical protein